MAETGKSLIDEAFMEAENIDKAFKANAKEILSHTMSSEIEEMVKESLEDSNGLNEDEEDENVELELVSSDEAGLDAGDDLEIGDEEMDAEEVEMELNDDEELEMDVIDLTDAEDSDVVNVFKKMSPEDEIEVVQDGDNIDIKDNETGAEYRIELGGEETEEEESEEMEMIDLEMDAEEMDAEDMEDMEDAEMDAEDMEDEDEDDMDDDMSEGVIYEIHMDEDYMDDEMMDDDMSELEDFVPTKTELEVDEVEVDDEIEENSTRNFSNGRRQRLRPDNFPKSLERPGVRNESKKPKFLKLIKENDTLKGEVSSIKTENETLKEDYNNMVDALKQFRNKLNEVAVFNSNLTYTVRLFTEHTTTKNEKLDIIKRFDEVKSLKESKNTYKSLVKEISTTKAPIKETIEEKFNETKGSGSAQITESNVYINPEFEQMKKLWDYDYKN